MSLNVVITGGSGGFGKLTALSLLERGCNVFATLRDLEGKNKGPADELKAAADNLTGKLSLVELDITSDEAFATAVKAITNETDHVDVLVNNAGIIGLGGPLEVTGVAQLQKMMEVNVYGSMRAINAFAPLMRAQGSGLIIQLTSTSASYNVPFGTGYIATKAAMERLLEGYRYDLAPFGVECVIMQPGAFNTNIMDKALGVSHPELTSDYSEIMKIMERSEASYGELAFDMDHSDPQIVATAIVDLIETPFGSRAFRTIVDSKTKHIVEPINALAEQTRLSMLEKLGVLSEVEPAGANKGSN